VAGGDALFQRPGRQVSWCGAGWDRPTNLAGIGNVYRAEVLFLRGLIRGSPPWRSRISAPLVNLAPRLLEANKERHGRITTGNWQRGQEYWVYGRRGRACRRCGMPIRSEGQQDRITFWCPSSQPKRPRRSASRGAPRSRRTAGYGGRLTRDTAVRSVTSIFYRTGPASPIVNSDSGADGDARPERIAYPVVHSARTANMAVSRPNAPIRPDTATRPSTRYGAATPR
jgi:hypothetical protein